MAVVTVSGRDRRGNRATVNVDIPVQAERRAAIGSSRVAELPSFVRTVDATRLYSVPSSWGRGEVVAGLARGCRTFVLSTKTADVAGLRAFLRARPADVTVCVTYWHEHEDNLRDGSLTLATYERNSRVVADVAHECGALYGPIHNGNNLTPDGKWIVGGWVDVSDTSIYDFWGTDIYCPKGQDPFERFAPIAEKVRALGLPLVIGETGAPNGPQQAAWAAKARAWVAEHDVLAACYWHSQKSSADTDWQLTDEAARAWFGV